MGQTRQDLAPKLQGETEKYSFDFAGRLPSGVTISSAAVTATVYSGTDASPSSIVSGSASISGSVVTQTITAGTLGVVYQLLCSATCSDGEILQIAGYLAIIPPVA